MPLIPKPNYNQIFASQAPEQDKPAVFNNYPLGWGVESRPNNGKPTIKGFNFLQQTSDLKALWILQNGAALPYDATIEYAEGAVVVKDGELQQWKGGEWVNVGARKASDIADSSGKTQQEINDLAEVSVKLYGASGNGTTSDVTAITRTMAATDQVTFTDGTYLIDSNITINKPVSFTKKAKLKVTNGAIVTFAAGVCDEICAHWFSGSTAIQDAVNSARNVKSVFIRSGTWMIDAPVIIPSSIPYWGINIRGASDSQAYETLESARSTIIKANSAMNVVIGNRLGWKDASGYYNKISNLTIDGNNLANYGYINGYQDTVTGVTVNKCLIGGIVFGALSNSTGIFNTSCSRNERGLILTGNPPTGTSTHAVIENSRFRQNLHSGVTICQAIGVQFRDCVIESNTNIGIEFVQNNNTDDFYAGSTASITSIQFVRVGMEANGRAISLSGVGVTNRITDVEFSVCNLVGWTTNIASPLGDIYTQRIRGLVFDRCTMRQMSMEAGDLTASVKFIGYQVADMNYPNTLYGTQSANVNLIKIMDNGDVIDDHMLFGQVAGKQVQANTSRLINRDEIYGSTITNFNQDAIDITLTLPTAGLNVTPRYSPTFKYVTVTGQATNSLTFQSGSNSYMIYEGVVKSTLSTGAEGNGLGRALQFTLMFAGAVQYWFVENIGVGEWY